MIYNPSEVWSILSEGSDDPDEVADLQVGLAKLPPQERAFLVAIAGGYTASSVMKQLGLRGNQTKFKRRVLLQLTALINGERE